MNKYNGDAIDTAYNVSGNQLSVAYDISGNPLVSDNTLTVMSYNAQWFTKINAYQAVQQTLLNRYNPDIIGFQEFTHDGAIVTAAATLLAPYPYVEVSAHYNYEGIASKYELTDIVKGDFTTNVGETRSYIKCNFEFCGKSICFITAHLEYVQDAVQKAQAEELLAMAEQENYVIIAADFNSYALSVSDADYINMYKPFVDAGYNLANSTAERGFTKTWGDSTTATSTDDLTYPCDNIITSSNISIDTVVFDTTKFEYNANNLEIDHIPIVAYLTIN